jgi:hypothetical protein
VDNSLDEFKGWGSNLPFCLPCGKAGGLQILHCQGIAVADYSFALDAPAKRDHTSDLIDQGLRLEAAASSTFATMGVALQQGFAIFFSFRR